MSDAGLEKRLLSLLWTWWRLGDPEDRLLGFCTRAERDACARGDPGPFRRRVRGLNESEPSLESLAARAYLRQDGSLAQLVEKMEVDREE